MIVNWLRQNRIASGILAVIRLFLGITWLIAGLHKLISGGFDTTGFLKNAISNPVKGSDGSVVFGPYVGFLRQVALPNADFFNNVIPIGELLVGLGLILGCLTTAAMFFGLLMNFSFLMAGTISSNPIGILLGVIILFAGFNAGKLGLDRWVIPFIGDLLPKDNSRVELIQLEHDQTIKPN